MTDFDSFCHNISFPITPLHPHIIADNSKKNPKTTIQGNPKEGLYLLSPDYGLNSIKKCRVFDVWFVFSYRGITDYIRNQMWVADKPNGLLSASPLLIVTIEIDMNHFPSKCLPIKTLISLYSALQSAPS